MSSLPASRQVFFMKDKDKKIERRKRRVRFKFRALTGLPRLSVFRSNQYIYAQIIDVKGNILVAANDVKLKANFKKLERATKIGQEIAKKALAAKIKRVVFDRGAYKYHGRVKALAEGAREAGLEF